MRLQWRADEEWALSTKRSMFSLWSVIPSLLFATLVGIALPSPAQPKEGEMPKVNLVGTVIKTAPARSIALVSVDGGPPMPHLIGSTVSAAWTIVAVNFDEITIRSRDGRAAKFAIHASDSALQPIATGSVQTPSIASHPQRVTAFPTPEMVEAAIKEFESPAND
ncbi:hypothetical protein J2W37_000658 [Variovorax paradoxus]|uniref:hypothetical protein n=1 Tax=Variovorax paradoxus TaxID=34073 RepID=UPI00277D5A6E|nr:hypothetical protein [Variovorax paradoxus]MDP9962952.1 hypothetical protein [Variovorax paradoxus]